MSDDTKSGTSDSSPKGGTENTGTGKTLAERLAEFEAATQDTGTPSKGERETIAKLTAEVERLQGIEASRSYRAEMDDFMIPTVKGEMTVHPKLVETWLNEQSEASPKLREIWENRFEDREAFEAAVKELTPKFEAYAKKEGFEGTAGTPKGDAKLAAALRSSRETQTGSSDLDNLNLEALSDNDFALKKAEIFRLSEAGQLQ